MKGERRRNRSGREVYFKVSSGLKKSRREERGEGRERRKEIRGKKGRNRRRGEESGFVKSYVEISKRVDYLSFFLGRSWEE